MKRSKLEAVLRRLIVLRITKRKRGRFTVSIPMLFDPTYPAPTFPTRKEALTYLFTKLRCASAEPIRIEVKGEPK
jgi:hypothetical protein